TGGGVVEEAPRLDVADGHGAGEVAGLGVDADGGAVDEVLKHTVDVDPGVGIPSYYWARIWYQPPQDHVALEVLRRQGRRVLPDGFDVPRHVGWGVEGVDPAKRDVGGSVVDPDAADLVGLDPEPGEVHVDGALPEDDALVACLGVDELPG